MDSDVRTRDRVAEHWHASERGDIEAEHAIYAADAVLDYPQSGERFRGRANIQAQRGGHPAKRHFTIRRISGIGDLWVSECIITYDGVPSFSVSIMEFTEGYVTHETQYFGDKFEAASWRAPLAEPIPADGGEPGQPAVGSPLERCRRGLGGWLAARRTGRPDRERTPLQVILGRYDPSLQVEEAEAYRRTSRARSASPRTPATSLWTSRPT